jgi:hypothetical protein
VKTKSELIALLERSGLAYDRLESGSSWLIVAPALAARIMGAGIDEENAFWVPPALSARGWGDGGNAGGQRTWIAPEAGPAAIFFSADGSRWEVPFALDPGRYESVPAARRGFLGYRSELTLGAADGASYPIVLTRSMGLRAAAPDWPENMLRLTFRHELKNSGGSLIDGRLGLWSILQLPCETPAKVLFGLSAGAGGGASPSGGASPLRPYFAALPEGVAGSAGRLAWLKAGGDAKCKVGLPAADSGGSIAFVRRSRIPGSAGPFLLTAIIFTVDPAAAYLDKPIHSGAEAARNGDAAQAYNDPGRGEFAFCEIEAHAPAPRLAPGESSGAEMEIIVARVESDEPGAWPRPLQQALGLEEV